MNLNGKGEGDELSLASSGLASSLHQLKIPLSKQQSMEEKSTRIKRRRTRRERNYVKFGRNVTGMIPEQRPNLRGRQKMLPPFWSSQLSSCSKSTPIKRPCVAKSVIITQNRLTQHLGMFNREVKSADIERLLSPRTEHEVMEMTPIQRASGGLLGEVVLSCSSGDMNQKSIPSKQVGGVVKDSSTVNEDSHFIVTPAVPVSIRELHPLASLQKVDASYQASLAPAAVTFDHQAEEAETFKGNFPVTLNDKENVPPVFAEGIELGKNKSLVRELAQDLQKLLDLKAIFPGRNLINEMRQTVISALLQQNKTLPDSSALTMLKKIAGSCNTDTFHADFKSPANEDQEKLHLELKSINCRSKNSNQPLYLKNQREQEQSFLTCFCHSPMHTTADKKLVQREDPESFADPELTDQHSFLAAVQPHSSLSLSSQPVNLARSSFASEEPFALQGASFRTAEPWHQGLGDALWEPRDRQERSEVANGAPLKKMDIFKRHCLPPAAHNTFGSASLGIDSKGPGCFPLADPQQYSYFYQLSPDQLNLQEAESVPGHNLHSSQELCGSQPLDLGLRILERATSESQTSFDVLKSIWSPNMPSKGVKLPISRALGYPCLTHQLLSSRELNLEQGQPKEFFQLCNIIPQQPHSFCRQHFQQEGYVPSRLPQMKNGFSVLGKPRVYCQKVSAEQGRIPENYQIWGLAEASTKMHSIRDKGTSRPGNQFCGLEGVLQPEDAQQLQALQQLPMSYFPPSEALESGDSPLCTLQGHLLGQSSPEPWAFPRMKLY